MTTGDRIKQLRTQKGFSQEELGRLIGVKKAAINKYENGIVVNLKRSTIEKLSIVLEVSPMYLMGFEEETPATNSGGGENPITASLRRQINEVTKDLDQDTLAKLLELSNLYLENLRKKKEKK